MKISNLLILGLVLFSPLTGCGKNEAPQSPDVAPEKVTPVELLKVVARDLVEEFTLPGSLEAWQDLRLAAEVAGVIEEVAVAEGESVRSGQELMRISILTLQTNFASAQAEFELLQKVAQRLTALVEEHLVSTQEYENAVGSLAVASAALRSAEVMLAKGVLTSPLNGVLEERYVDPGEYAGVGDPLVRLVQIDRLKIIVDVPEKDISFLQRGADVKIDAVGAMERGAGRLKGTISQIGTVADPLTRTYRVKIDMANPHAALRPGMIVRSHFVRRRLEQALLVPLYAVIDREDHHYLFVKNAGKVRQQEVSLGTVLGAEVVVLKGLVAGDEIVVKGQQLLLDGALISAGEKR